MSPTNTKPWWQSMTIWGGIGQFLVLGAGIASGVAPDPTDSANASSAVIEIATGIFALLGILGRFRATKKIG
ncbi:MAG: hypothetical protein K2Q27_08370 [Novosphingobium sp.]|nr:hypothetical protein [Novosphingobium sp.]